MTATHDVQHWGRIDGKDVWLFTLRAGSLVMKATNYGCIITELHVPDRDGRTDDIVLGFDSLDGYLAGHPYFGAIVGRCANRIAGASFTLGDRTFQLAKNNNARHHLHGGVKGFDKHVWRAVVRAAGGDVSLQLTRTSPDGEENYPGQLAVKVVYTLTHDNELKVVMTARTKATTIVNLAQHTYWNLAGHASGDIKRHEARLHAVAYTPADATLIPTGQIAPVARTPFDFIQPKPLGRDLIHVGDSPRGYDTNFVISPGSAPGSTSGDSAVSGAGGQLRPCAVVHEPTTGRRLELLTDQPGVQLYTGNFLDGTITGKSNAVYHPYQAFCLETQHFPDAIHHPDFPSPILSPGQTYRHTMLHRFSAR
jgi:aldose 1-epimerase